MEPSGTSIHLKKVLRSYQSAASSSLSGPNAILSAYGSPAGCAEEGSMGADSKPRMADEFQTLKLKRHKSQREIHPPILTAADRSWTEWSETLLEGQPIACFVVGGEKRLCLPQVMNSVLGQFHISEINAACDELHIYCSLCSPKQLEMLKTAAILPRTAPSCGLITATDAQRLCSLLLRTPNRIITSSAGVKREEPQHGWFRVYHECFGKCEGICKPELYESSTSACIECADCGMLLAPQHFVSHAHRGLEKRTCHWGFDAQAWRAYLLLARRQIGYEMLLRQLDKFKAKFAGAAAGAAAATAAAVVLEAHGVSAKRKQKVDDPVKSPSEPEALSKKIKEEPVDLAPYVITPHGGWYPAPMISVDPLRKLYSYSDGLYQPNVTLPAAVVPEKIPQQQQQQVLHNPEIELSTTDTDDSDSTSGEQGEKREQHAKLSSKLTPELNRELTRVQESLAVGGCNPAETEKILEAFRRLCLRVALTEEQLDWTRKEKQQQSEECVKDMRFNHSAAVPNWTKAGHPMDKTSVHVKREPLMHF